jgi:hypothetical protein
MAVLRLRRTKAGVFAPAIFFARCSSVRRIAKRLARLGQQALVEFVAPRPAAGRGIVKSRAVADIVVFGSNRDHIAGLKEAGVLLHDDLTTLGGGRRGQAGGDRQDENGNPNIA